jgi:uncharacterized sulfatase
MRAIRTEDFLFVRNFAPDRWPMGAPYAVTETSAPTATELETNTRVAFPDMDASPTKAWLVAHRNEAQGKAFYERAFAKRPAEELYDLRSDPPQTQNVAVNAAYRAEKDALARRLMKVLVDTGDPRVTGDRMRFERPPFTDPEQIGPRRAPAKPSGVTKL